MPENFLPARGVGSHLVILGAGASRAACPHGDKNGRKLPLMNDLVEVVGLSSKIEEWGLDPQQNFENIYNDLYEKNDVDKIEYLKHAIKKYFNKLEIPDQPTVYDHLVLSLRDKDVIATFNWDPLLSQAMTRNQQGLYNQAMNRDQNVSLYKPPFVIFLHGNVSIGHCVSDKRIGHIGTRCPQCRRPFRDTTMLFPIKKKNYNADSFTSAQWENFKKWLGRSFGITVFGYSAPKTDVEAKSAIKSAWIRYGKPRLGYWNFITTENESTVAKHWKDIIPNATSFTCRTFYESTIAKNPRRTIEAGHGQFLEAEWVGEHPISTQADFPQLWNEVGKLAEDEYAHKTLLSQRSTTSL